MKRILLMILLASNPLLFAQEQLSTHRVRPGDWLKITVWHEPELSRTLLVMPNGAITMPLVGDIYAEGLTLTNLRDQISQRLARYVQDPSVNVTLGKAPSLKLQYKILPDTYPQAQMQHDSSISLR